MYYEQLTLFDDAIEHDFNYAGEYGAKGETRKPRRKATPEQIKKQNQKNREIRMRRKIHKNFHENDLWVTLKYQAGTKKTVKELSKDFGCFIRKLRYQYKKRGVTLKWIARKEIGARGGLHIHILVNRIRGEDTDIIIKSAWGNTVWHTSLYDQGGYEKLAEYIVKEPTHEIRGQMSLFPEEEQDELIRYSCSRNLEEPEQIRKEYSHWTMKRILDAINSGDYMKKATPGYLIDKESIRSGINPYTGLSYLHYIEYKIQEKRINTNTEVT